jgi:type IV pilus assembly protein PilW
MAMIKIYRNEAGFTLVELLVSMVILGVVLTGVVRMFSGTNHYNNAQEMIVTLNQDLRAAKQLMVDEIRSAACNPKFTNGIGFQKNANDARNTDSNTIHFTRDIDNGDNDQFLEPDGDTDDENEDIIYFRGTDPPVNILNAGDNTVGKLYRAVSGANPQPLVDNVVDLQFIYYDANMNVLSDAVLNTNSGIDRIATVEVVIVGQVARPALVNPGARQQTQRYRIRVRNV